jgi:catalase
MLWHLFMVHDDYGRRVGEKIGLTARDVAWLPPLGTQLLTDDEKKRLRNLGNNGDRIDPTVWGTWTSSVHNHQARAEDVLNGMKGVKIEPEPKPQPVS